MTTGWELLAVLDGVEFWAGVGGSQVYARRVSAWNWIGPDGTPNSLRWEGSREWFDRWYGGRS